MRSSLTGGSLPQVPVSTDVRYAGHREALAVIGLVQTGDDGPFDVLANAEQDSQSDWGIPMWADLVSKRLSSLLRHLPSQMISSSVI